jgi:hypothetical protein
MAATTMGTAAGGRGTIPALNSRRARWSRGLHLLLSRLLCGFGLGGRTACSPVCFDLSDGLRDELAAIDDGVDCVD